MPRIERSSFDELVEELFKTQTRRKAKSYERFSNNK